MNTQETCITEIIENELRDEVAEARTKLKAALVALDILETFYTQMSMKNHLIPVKDIPGYAHLKEVASK